MHLGPFSILRPYPKQKAIQPNMYDKNPLDDIFFLIIIVGETKYGVQWFTNLFKFFKVILKLHRAQQTNVKFCLVIDK